MIKFVEKIMLNVLILGLVCIFGDKKDGILSHHNLNNIKQLAILQSIKLSVLRRTGCATKCKKT